jgi:nicotinamide-nucleotide amidase
LLSSCSSWACKRGDSITSPKAIICLTGSELTRGETRDLNGTFLAVELTTLGIEVDELRILPDDPARLRNAFAQLSELAEVVIVSGGLGPTADDHTVRALADAFGRGVIRDPEAQARMRERALARAGSEENIPANFYKQAEVVAGSRVLSNPVGLAPGCLVETRRGFIAVLPGVPRELTAMFRERLLPEIQARFSLEPPRILRAKVLGLGESWVEARVQKLGIDFGRLEYGISAQPGEVLIKLVAHRPEAQAAIDEARERLIAEFGADLMLLPEGLKTASGEPPEIEHSFLVHRLLVDSGKTVATAESCTGGLIGKRLTDHAGSSAYFLGSVVAYHDLVKERLLGVERGLIEKHGAVSAEVCRAMALAARRIFGAGYCLSVTGIAGPGGATPEKPAGLVFIGLAKLPERRGNAGAAPEEPEVIVERHQFWGNRRNVRALSAVRALDLIRRDLEGRG